MISWKAQGLERCIISTTQKQKYKFPRFAQKAGQIDKVSQNMHFGLDRIWFRTNTQQVNRSHVDKGASNYNAEFRDVPIAQIENKEYLLQFKFAARLCSALHLNLSDSAWSDFYEILLINLKFCFSFLNQMCHVTSGPRATLRKSGEDSSTCLAQIPQLFKTAVPKARFFFLSRRSGLCWMGFEKVLM